MPFFIPKLVIRLVQATLLSSIGIILLASFFQLPLLELFTLNLNTIENYFVWQPITALFLLPNQDLSFGFMLDLVFTSGLLALLGSQIYDIMGKNRFLQLYIGSSLAASALALTVMQYTGTSAMLSLCPAALLALTTIWVICTPAKNIALFFLFPLPASWFLAIALLTTIGSSLIQGEFARTAAYLGAFLFSYFLAVAFWHLRSPFSTLWRFEASLKRIVYACRTFLEWRIQPILRKIGKK